MCFCKTLVSPQSLHYKNFHLSVSSKRFSENITVISCRRLWKKTNSPCGRRGEFPSAGEDAKDWMIQDLSLLTSDTGGKGPPKSFCEISKKLRTHRFPVISLPKIPFPSILEYEFKSSEGQPADFSLELTSFSHHSGCVVPPPKSGPSEQDREFKDSKCFPSHLYLSFTMKHNWQTSQAWTATVFLVQRE